MSILEQLVIYCMWVFHCFYIRHLACSTSKFEAPNHHFCACMFYVGPQNNQNSEMLVSSAQTLSKPHPRKCLFSLSGRGVCIGELTRNQDNKNHSVECWPQWHCSKWFALRFRESASSFNARLNIHRFSFIVFCVCSLGMKMLVQIKGVSCKSCGQILGVRLVEKSLWAFLNSQCYYTARLDRKSCRISGPLVGNVIFDPITVHCL